MINEIAAHIKESLVVTEDDSIVLNGSSYRVDKSNFTALNKLNGKSVAFIDGGQANILNAANFCLSFLRVVGVVIQDNIKVKEYRKEFYLLVTVKDGKFITKIFGDKIIDEFVIDSKDNSIRVGNDPASITSVVNIARRCSELALAKEIESDYKIIDGTLEVKYEEEKKYYSQGLSSLAKSSTLCTSSGNSPIILLNKIGPNGEWKYFLNERTSFVKLNSKAKYVFRFEGVDCLSYLVENCCDALFLGYPYGLLLVDKLARISNEEKNSLKMKFLLNSKNREISEYLFTQNAHDVLDNIG
jgi:hypothetical protein